METSELKNENNENTTSLLYYDKDRVETLLQKSSLKTQTSLILPTAYGEREKRVCTLTIELASTAMASTFLECHRRPGMRIVSWNR
jgi:hypothetical protein